MFLNVFEIVVFIFFCLSLSFPSFLLSCLEYRVARVCSAYRLLCATVQLAYMKNELENIMVLRKEKREKNWINQTVKANDRRDIDISSWDEYRENSSSSLAYMLYFMFTFFLFCSALSSLSLSICKLTVSSFALKLDDGVNIKYIYISPIAIVAPKKKTTTHYWIDYNELNSYIK